MQKQKGFTLIELLVVIAILGLLSTLAVVSLNNARAKARDARRVSDVKQIQTALELFFMDAGRYPTTNTEFVIGDPLSYGGETYMTKIPSAPTPQDGGATCDGLNTYTYTRDASDVRKYTLEYCLGSETGGIPAGLNTASEGGVSEQ